MDAELEQVTFCSGGKGVSNGSSQEQQIRQTADETKEQDHPPKKEKKSLFDSNADFLSFDVDDKKPKVMTLE